MSQGTIICAVFIYMAFALFAVSWELIKLKEQNKKKIDVDKLTKGLSKQQIRDLIIKLSENLY